MRGLTLLLLISALISQFVASTQVLTIAAQETGLPDLSNSLVCSKLYFFNGIVIRDSLIDSTLYLETPRNISLDDGFRQEVHHLVKYNLDYDPDRKIHHFNVTLSRSFLGFFLSFVEVCYEDSLKILSVIAEAVSNPKIATNGSIPAWIKETFVKTPEETIVEKVVPEYESWFYTTYGYPVREASTLGIAVTATRFVTGYYINYTPSSLPRILSEVIETRRGDCDDMSRVIVELLSYYDIPSLIAYGYVYIPQLGNLTIVLENTTYIFSSNGPHAFPMAYIPGLGWISLDTLAWSLIVHPVVFEGYTRDTAVSPSDVQETVELHRSLHAIQILRIMNEETYWREFGSIKTTEDLVESLRQMLLQYMSDNTVKTPSTTLPVQTGEVDTSTVTQTQSTLSREQTDTSTQQPVRIDHDRIVEILVGLSMTSVFTIILVIYLSRRVFKTM